MKTAWRWVIVLTIVVSYLSMATLSHAVLGKRSQALVGLSTAVKTPQKVGEAGTPPVAVTPAALVVATAIALYWAVVYGRYLASRHSATAPKTAEETLEALP